ncbi:MAG: twitching motility protein PilT, partial [Actinomycetota bacterium]|nr:twitching motility protein PilT [Actinomycetota bacterium]
MDEQNATPAGLDGYFGAATPAPPAAPAQEPTWTAAPPLQPASPMQMSTDATVSFAMAAPPAPPVAAPVVPAPAAPMAAPQVAPAAAAVAAASMPLPPAPPAPPAPPSVPEQTAPMTYQQQEQPAAAVRVGAESNSDSSNFLADLLIHVLDTNCSDLHMTVGAHPTVRLNGHLTPMEEYPVLTPQVVQKTLYAILTQKQREKFEEELEL